MNMEQSELLHGDIFCEKTESTSFVIVDPVGMVAKRNNMKSAQLTAREFQILSFLSLNSWVATRQDILNRVWSNINISNGTLDVHISSLRKKLATLKVEITQLEDCKIALTHR